MFSINESQPAMGTGVQRNYCCELEQNSCRLHSKHNTSTNICTSYDSYTSFLAVPIMESLAPSGHSLLLQPCPANSRNTLHRSLKTAGMNTPGSFTALYGGSAGSGRSIWRICTGSAFCQVDISEGSHVKMCARGDAHCRAHLSAVADPFGASLCRPRHGCQGCPPGRGSARAAPSGSR